MNYFPFREKSFVQSLVFPFSIPFFPFHLFIIFSSLLSLSIFYSVPFPSSPSPLPFIVLTLYLSFFPFSLDLLCIPFLFIDFPFFLLLSFSFPYLLPHIPSSLTPVPSSFFHSHFSSISDTHITEPFFLFFFLFYYTGESCFR